MQEAELFLVFIRPLNELEISYMVTGSTAAIIYGEPRLTHDIDLVVDLQPRQIEPFYNAFNTPEFYVPPVEVLNVEAARSHNGHFNLLHQYTGFKADIYMKGNEELHTWAFERRKLEKMGESKVWVASPEYVIIRKLMYYNEGKSEKHLEDIRNILTGSEKDINFESIEDKIKKYKLSECWSLIVNK